MNEKIIENMGIEAISVYLPSNVINNLDNKNFKKNEIEQICNMTGVTTKRAASLKETTDYMMFMASENLIKKFNVNLEDIGCIVSVTQTPENKMPGVSYVLGSRLGLNSNCLTYDINLGCSGFTHGLFLIFQLLGGISGKKGLLVVGDSLSKYINPLDKATTFIFGDGAAAILISKIEKNFSFFKWKSIFNSYDKISLKNNYPEKNYLFMDGMEVFSFAIKEVPDLVEKTLLLANTSKDKIDYFIFHQANEMILKYIQRKLLIESKKNIIKIDNIGNTSAASIPIALALKLIEDNEENYLKKICFCGFGVGLSLSCIVIDILNLKYSICYGGKND